MASVGGLAWLTIGIGEVYRDNSIPPIYREAIEKVIVDFGVSILGKGEF
jgi:hypothetical protein